MPWTAKQLKLFRAAAHNPAIAKRTGIKQADAERMSKEGLKKMAGGGKALINRQDTKHGAMDMPFKKLNKFAGMKKGGKIKRYDDGGDVDEGIRSYGERQGSTSIKNVLGHGETEGPEGKSENVKISERSYAPRAAARPVTRSGPSRSEMAGMARAPAVNRTPAAPDKPAEARATPSDSTNAGAATSMAPRGQLGRLAKKSAETSDEQKQRVTERLSTLASMAPAARGIQAAYRGARALGAGASGARGAMEKAAEGTASRYRGETNPRGWENMSLSERAKATGGYKKGGMMKESKAMMSKEVAFMKKKGAPKSMIKHEKAEMGAMRKGGMAKYARGGGIESRGKTKGTIVKMAAGGLASGHKAADGIAQRGKTKGMKVSMKGGGYC